MKFKNYTLGIQVLKYVSDHSNCTIPQVRDALGIPHTSPPNREEKDLYKVISSLADSRHIIKKKIAPISSGGAHFHLKSTQRGSFMITSFRTVFSNILEDYSAFDKIKDKESEDPEDLLIKFSISLKRVLESSLHDIINKLPKDPKLNKEKRDSINFILDSSHRIITNRVSNIIDRLT